MSVRLVITMRARPGKGDELAAAMEQRHVEVRTEPGCRQFEIFQSANDRDKLVLLELWDDQQALDEHIRRAQANPQPPALAELREAGPGEREDYEYNRTR